MTRQRREGVPAVGLSPQALESLVGSLYQLGSATRCDRLSSGLNELFRVEADGRLYALKIYRLGWRSREEVLAEIAVLHHLGRRGVRIARPIAQTDGQEVWSLATAAGERQAVLFEWANGRELAAADAADWHAAGRSLAEIHSATDNLAGAPLRYGWEHLLWEPIRALDPYLSDRVPDRHYLRELAGRLRKRIAAIPASDLDWGYCHGDFRPANLSSDEVSGELTILDFEMGGIGFRGYDIAYTQTNLHRLALELLWGAPPVEEHERLWSTFLTGYTERRQLSGRALATIPVFVALRPLSMMATLLETARRPAGEETWPPRGQRGLPGGDLFDRSLSFLRAWDQAFLAA
jgi:Ser/Thr protein kinase RdoA (MazF antagonist)